MRPEVWLALVLAAQLGAAPALAGPFARLQVLLPGETAAPGTTSGKTGTPSPQTGGIPFSVKVNACDDSWTVVTTVTHSIRILSSDASASLPAAAQLVSGTGNYLVILNADGNFTIYAHDQSDVTIPDGPSAAVRSLVLQSLEFANIPREQTAAVPFAVTITARNPNGEAVTGFSGLVRLRQLTGPGTGRISPATVTLSGGRWTGNVSVYRADETAPSTGTAVVAGEVDNHPTQSGTSNGFVVHPGQFRRLQIVMPGRTAWVSWRRRTKFRVIASSQAESGASIEMAGLLPPAELMSMSICPRASSAARVSRDGAPSGMRSISTTAGLDPPAAAISCARSSSSDLRRAATHSLTPSAARAFAMARPMPMLAPVTSAVFPFNCRSISAPNE